MKGRGVGPIPYLVVTWSELQVPTFRVEEGVKLQGTRNPERATRHPGPGTARSQVSIGAPVIYGQGQYAGDCARYRTRGFESSFPLPTLSPFVIVTENCRQPSAKKQSAISRQRSASSSRLSADG